MSTGTQSVPWSIRSSFVKMPMVRSPCGSTTLAICSASELAMSELAGVTARIRQLSFLMYLSTISRICRSISGGWSPTGILVSPGRSTSVSVSTFGE